MDAFYNVLDIITQVIATLKDFFANILDMFKEDENADA